MEEYLEEKSLDGSVAQSFKMIETLHHSHSKYQDIKVVLTQALGKVLLLDDIAMISDKDEFIYHEVMTHVPMLSQEQTRRVLVIGAGDGGVIRELVKYRSIKEITLVEIDQEVTNVSREFFPKVASGLSDIRVNCVFEDAIDFVRKEVENVSSKYDLIISDSTDPVGIAKQLYERDFYADINSLLSKDGIFMCQTENPFYDEYNIKKIYQDLKSEFQIVQPICAPILIYPGIFWTFAFCSKTNSLVEISSQKLQEYNEFSKDLKWHNPKWQQASIHLPNYVTKSLGLSEN